jgi:hypothetical protein
MPAELNDRSACGIFALTAQVAVAVLRFRRLDDPIESAYLSVAGSLLVHKRESLFVELLEEVVPVDGFELARSLALRKLKADHSRDDDA